jgi:hypothetical protein
MSIAVVAAVLTAVVAIPAGLTQQAETSAGASPAAGTSTAPADSFTIVADSNTSGVWRLNSRTGDVWFCFATTKPKCFPAEVAKK